jgi:hypothetical protein
MVAALEIYKETGSATCVHELIAHGRWSDTDYPPRLSRPMPARDWLGSFRNWLGF